MLSCSAVKCEVSTIGTSKHCESHSRQFKPLYLKYKHLHIHIKEQLQVPLNSYDVYALLKLSSSLEELYNLRSDYRKTAFRPEYHDIGHTRILHEVLHKLDDVRDQLAFMFNKKVDDEENKKVDDVENKKIDNEISTSINFVTNIRKSVVNQHKEEWDKQSQVDYEYNKQIEAKLNFLISGSSGILDKIGMSNSKLTLNILVIIFALKHYLKFHNKDSNLLDIVFLNSIHNHIEKHKLKYTIYTDIYRSLVTKEPQCLINSLKKLPIYKHRAIGFWLFNNSILLSLHGNDSDAVHFCEFKSVGNGWEFTNKADNIYILGIYNVLNELRSSMTGLDDNEKLKKIRQMKHTSVMNSQRKHK